MRNLTITVDEDVARWARIHAAREGTSVSRMVGEVLREMMEREEAYEAAMHAFLGAAPVALKHGGAYPDRDALHER